MPKNYRGNAPNSDAGWRRGGKEFEKAREIAVAASGWHLWFLETRVSESFTDWHNLKLWRNWAQNKANYWISYSPELRQMSGVRDWYLLKKNRPALAVWALEFCIWHYNTRFELRGPEVTAVKAMLRDLDAAATAEWEFIGSMYT